jgi:hypothetical protein
MLRKWKMMENADGFSSQEALSGALGAILPI